MLRGVFGYGLYGFLFLLLYIMYPNFISKELWITLLILASLFQHLVYPEFWRMYEKNKKLEYTKKESESEYQSKMSKLNGLASTFKILNDARKENKWQPAYDNVWNELDSIINPKNS